MPQSMRVLVALALLAAAATAVHVNVPASSVECFYTDAERIKHGLSLNYEVLRGVGDALETQVTDPSGHTMYSNRGPSGRFFGAIQEDGLHTVCFENTVSSAGDVVVGFSFHADDPTHEVLSNADATKIEQVQELEDLVSELSSALDTVRDTQSFMKTITLYYDHMIAHTHNRIAWWTALEALVLIVVAVTQVTYLRRTLEVRRML